MKGAILKAAIVLGLTSGVFASNVVRPSIAHAESWDLQTLTSHVQYIWWILGQMSGVANKEFVETKAVIARSLTIVDEQGQPQIIMSSQDSSQSIDPGPVLMMYYPKGQVRIVPWAGGAPLIQIVQGNKQITVDIDNYNNDKPSIRMYSKQNTKFFHVP